MQSARIALSLFVVIWLLACSEGAGDPGVGATACLALVSFHRGVDAELTGFASEAGRVRIDYRSADQEGVALCQVRTRDDASIEITGALVDENRLRDDEIDAFRNERR